MSFMSFEGTADYIVATPALIVSFKASGSVAAGTFVAWDAGNTGDVYNVAASIASGSYRPAGFALATAASGTVFPVLVWGYAKNIHVTGSAVNPGNPLVAAGTNGGTSGSAGTAAVVGTFTTAAASGAKALAFINCLS